MENKISRIKGRAFYKIVYNLLKNGCNEYTIFCDNDTFAIKEADRQVFLYAPQFANWATLINRDGGIVKKYGTRDINKLKN